MFLGEILKIKIALVLFFSIWIILLAKIYYISIKSNSYYEGLAKQNAIKTEDLAPLRGLIFDVNGKPIAVNKLGFSIGIKPGLSSKKNLKKLEKELKFIKSLFPLLKIDKIKKSYLKQDSPYMHKFVRVVDFISYNDIIKEFTKLSLDKNLEIKIASKRYYPNSDLASHIIGYVGKANSEEMEKDNISKLTEFIGKTGIEKYYNKVLEGEKGVKKVKVNAYNKEIETISTKLPTSNNIKLTIDIRLQKYISNLFKNKSGSLIVMNARNGKILAAGSFPEYDLNDFVSGISEKKWKSLSTDFNHPFTNKITKGLYPPGSVIKMGVALAFLRSGLITTKTTIFDTGSITLGKREFRDWKRGGHGYVNMEKAIRESCDTYFYDGALKVGIEKISPTLRDLGFGKKTGIDLPNEFIGTVPGRKWKMKKYNQPWYRGETLITAIGQGYFLVTPIQIARYTALLATGFGVIPHLIDSVNGVKAKFGKDKNIFTKRDKSYLRKIRKYMYEVTHALHGTATRHIHTKVQIAGKTGTAQVVGIPQGDKKRMKEDELKYFKRSHAWLTTYGPYKNPQYVVTAIVEHGGHGGSAAGKIISKIYDKLLELGYVK